MNSSVKQKITIFGHDARHGIVGEADSYLAQNSNASILEEDKQALASRKHKEAAAMKLWREWAVEALGPISPEPNAHDLSMKNKKSKVLERKCAELAAQAQRRLAASATLRCDSDWLAGSSTRLVGKHAGTLHRSSHSGRGAVANISLSKPAGTSSKEAAWAAREVRKLSLYQTAKALGQAERGNDARGTPHYVLTEDGLPVEHDSQQLHDHRQQPPQLGFRRLLTSVLEGSPSSPTDSNIVSVTAEKSHSCVVTRRNTRLSSSGAPQTAPSIRTSTPGTALSQSLHRQQGMMTAGLVAPHRYSSTIQVPPTHAYEQDAMGSVPPPPMQRITFSSTQPAHTRKADTKRSTLARPRSASPALLSPRSRSPTNSAGVVTAAERRRPWSATPSSVTENSQVASHNSLAMVSRGEGSIVANLKRESEVLRAQLDEAHAAVESRAETEAQLRDTIDLLRARLHGQTQREVENQRRLQLHNRLEPVFDRLAEAFTFQSPEEVLDRLELLEDDKLGSFDQLLQTQEEVASLQSQVHAANIRVDHVRHQLTTDHVKSISRLQQQNEDLQQELGSMEQLNKRLTERQQMLVSLQTSIFELWGRCQADPAFMAANDGGSPIKVRALRDVQNRSRADGGEGVENALNLMSDMDPLTVLSLVKEYVMSRSPALADRNYQDTQRVANRVWANHFRNKSNMRGNVVETFEQLSALADVMANKITLVTSQLDKAKENERFLSGALKRLEVQKRALAVELDHKNRVMRDMCGQPRKQRPQSAGPMLSSPYPGSPDSRMRAVPQVPADGTQHLTRPTSARHLHSLSCSTADTDAVKRVSTVSSHQPSTSHLATLSPTVPDQLLLAKAPTAISATDRAASNKQEAPMAMLTHGATGRTDIKKASSSAHQVYLRPWSSSRHQSSPSRTSCFNAVSGFDSVRPYSGAGPRKPFDTTKLQQQIKVNARGATAGGQQNNKQLMQPEIHVSVISRPGGEHWDMMGRSLTSVKYFNDTDKTRSQKWGALFEAQQSKSKKMDDAYLLAMRSQWTPPYKAKMESSFLSRVEMRAALAPTNAA